jgi:MATE family multidrug resistance protein
VPVIRAALWLLGTSATTGGYIEEYFSIRIWSSPASLWNFVVIGWLLGMQNARGPLAVILTINILNIVLDLVFVLMLGMDVAGVALATLIAELAGVAVGAWFVVNAMRDHQFAWRPEKYLVLTRYRAIFMINGNLFLRTMALMFCFAFITAQGARLGDNILAANAILMNFQFFLSYALDGIAHAAEALTGKATGARNRTGLVLAVNRTLFWSTALAGLFVITYWVAGETIINVLTDQPLIRDTAHTYLPWLIVLPVLSVWSFLYDGVFVGTTRSREMRMVMTGALILVFLPAWYLLQHLGNHALWLAFALFMTARSLGMHIWYRRLLISNQLVSN